MLPYLSAYMGHENLLGTERYLKMTVEIFLGNEGAYQRRVFLDNSGGRLSRKIEARRPILPDVSPASLPVTCRERGI